jgi:hypothetical protein
VLASTAEQFVQLGLRTILVSETESTTSRAPPPPQAATRADKASGRTRRMLAHPT